MRWIGGLAAWPQLQRFKRGTVHPVWGFRASARMFQSSSATHTTQGVLQQSPPGFTVWHFLPRLWDFHVVEFGVRLDVLEGVELHRYTLKINGFRGYQIANQKRIRVIWVIYGG